MAFGPGRPFFQISALLRLFRGVQPLVLLLCVSGVLFFLHIADEMAEGETLGLDRTLVLALAEGKERAAARDGHSGDRIGGRDEDFHHKVDLAFRMIAAEEPERVKIVEASGTKAEVTERLLGAIQDILP